MDTVAQILHRGAVIPAHPLALTAERKLDERHQVALTRYYCDAGAGGVAVGVHTTQFAIRDPHIGLYEPALKLAAGVVAESGKRILKIAGVCGQTPQAAREATIARTIGYDLGLLSLAALADASHPQLLQPPPPTPPIIPLLGFSLQPAVGGRPLSYYFWRAVCEIQNVA